MKKWLIKGKECVGKNWRNFQHIYNDEKLQDAVMRVRWKYRKSDKVIIESAFVQVWEQK